MALPSVMGSRFSQVPQAEIPRSSFDLSHGYKTTFDAGLLIPVFANEALPGDTWNVDLTIFARLATPIHPVMDNMYMSTFFFAVPYRLVWDNWEKFNGAQDNPEDSTDFVLPTMPGVATTGYTVGSLSDYLGIPTGVPDLEHVSLWHRAYNLVWNEWFRDQNLQDSVVVDKDDGPDDPADYDVLRRGKRHDYFTSALPWPQKGDSVDLPLGTVAPITGLGTISDADQTAGTTVKETGGNDVNYARAWSSAVGRTYVEEDGTTGYPNVYADLSTATAATINQLRQAFQIQKLLERDARGGTRYTEIVRAHFGVTSPDARLQRPEYLGGGRTPVNITPVPQTSESNNTDQGNLAGFGTVNASRHGFSWSATEHCLLIGLVCVDADLTYQQGLNRRFSRSTRYDMMWPALAMIGEQTVLNKEIFAQGSDDADADAAAFGYQERYAEYRYEPSKITGQFRSTFAQSLDVWHLSEEFGNLPVLNQEFIQSDPPIDRVIAAASEPHFLYDSYFQIRVARPLPTYGVPGMIDHF